MPFRYKIDILRALKDKGYTTYIIRQKHYLSEFALTQIRQNKMVSLKNIDTICHLLECKPSDIIEYYK